MMERHFLLAMPLIYPVLLLVPKSSALFLTSLATLIQWRPLLWWILLLVLIILLKRKELNMEVSYNRTVRGYCNGSLTNGRRLINITLWFYNGCTMFNKKNYYYKILAVTDLQRILTPSFIIVGMFALVVTYFFLFGSFIKIMTD